MTLQIIVDSTIHGLEARIQKTTFDKINRQFHLPTPIVDGSVVVGELFEAAYMLRFWDDQTGLPDCLFVSQDVKSRFYADKATLDIRVA